MEEVLRNIPTNTARGWDVRQGNDVNQYSTFKDFMDTKPPVIKEAVEPLEADEWLNSIEQRFCLLRMTKDLKIEFASH
jgi:hypothetical protein